MWFCVTCKPKVIEKLKENEIEIHCNKHFEKYKAQLDNLAQLVDTKMNKQETIDLIETKISSKAENHVVPSQEIISQLIQKQVEQQSFADIVNDAKDRHPKEQQKRMGQLLRKK